MQEEVIIEKLVAGGQAIATLNDGRKCFLWGALPGERVKVRIYKNKKDYAEAVVEQLIEKSQYRIEPLEPETYLANSPWQIIDYQKEGLLKQEILEEVFQRNGLNIQWQKFYQDEREYNYRNKMEYNFWFDKDNNRLDLAIHARASHRKIIVKKSNLASKEINDMGQKLVQYLNDKKIAGRDLKSVIIRSNQAGEAGLSLFVKNKSLGTSLSDIQKIFPICEIIYSEPKSPASVFTASLAMNNPYLTDSLLGKKFSYSIRSFFQVNIPVYERVLSEISENIEGIGLNEIIDLYSGVGSIGLSVVNNRQKLKMVDVSSDSIEQANKNIKNNHLHQAIIAKSEDIIDIIKKGNIVILDPPRAGLHQKLIDKLISVKPPQIIYLSCNPVTQARDLEQLSDSGYLIKKAQGYNFFPRTPHIETLVTLQIKGK